MRRFPGVSQGPSTEVHMRSGKLVIGIGLVALASGCYGYGYGYGYHRPYYYGGAYYNGAVAYQAPPPEQQQVVVQGQPGQVTVQTQVGAAPPPAVGGEGIQGSDGTRGWRVTSTVPAQDFQRLLQLAGRASCQVEASTQVEFRATCAGNVHLVLRFDQQNVYKLCAPGTDPGACAQTWSTIGN